MLHTMVSLFHTVGLLNTTLHTINAYDLYVSISTAEADVNVFSFQVFVLNK